MVDSVSCLRYAECSRAPHYISNGHGYPKQTISCTWPYVVPIGEDPAAHGHWCAFTDLYHTIPYHTYPTTKLHQHKRTHAHTNTSVPGLNNKAALLCFLVFSRMRRDKRCEREQPQLVANRQLFAQAYTTNTYPGPYLQKLTWQSDPSANVM